MIRIVDGAAVAPTLTDAAHRAVEIYMDLPIAWLIGVGLFLLILGPFLYLQFKRGKAHGHTWFTWWKPRGHSDIGPDVGPRPTSPGGVDEARGARY